MAVGTKLGRYELLARIASGGMGEIFLARMAGAAGFEKLCVIKRILPHLAGDGRFREMLVGEARIAASMSHANICHVYALEETDDQLYMVMEYLEGAPLLQLLRLGSRRRQQLPLGLVAGVIQQASEGLHYAHELCDRTGARLGIVHRDVSPSNLFLTETGVVKVVDFGIAKAHDAAATDTTGTHEVKGKYAYMAPEQLRSQTVDRRADVFSLAVVAFETLTCRRLFHRKTEYLTFRALLDQPLPDLREYRADAPPAAMAVLARALERDPAARCPTARDLGNEFVQALGVAPWNQREIGELVRTEFAAELRAYSAELSKAMHRPNRDRSHTIPVVSPVRAEVDPVDAFAPEVSSSAQPIQLTEPSFPVKQSGIRNAVVSYSQNLGARVSAPSTLPPLGAPSAPVRPRASILPFLAIGAGALVVLAIGLVLVNRLPRPISSHLVLPAAAPAESIASQLPRRAPTEPYGAALSRHESAFDDCATSFADDLPADARATLVVGVDGRTHQVSLEPPAAARSELGRCIRDVLQGMTFPAASDEKQLALGLALRH